MAETTLDLTNYEFIKKRCESTRGLYGTRNKTMDEMEAIYLLLWTKGKPTDPGISPVICPDARNNLKGGTRLLKATEPKVKIPYAENDAEAKLASSALEKAGSAMFYANSRLRDIPIHSEGLFSAMLFGQIAAGISLTKDLEDQASKGSSKSYTKRIAEIKKRTPIIIDIYDPRTCYPIFDQLGMAGFHRSTMMTAFDIVDIWGDKGKEILSIDLKKGTEINYKDKLQYCDYWDWDLHVTWIQEKQEKPLMYEEHNMEEIPIVFRTASGSRLHKEASQFVQPFLYEMSKSGIQDAQNMAYTMLFDHVFTLGAAATYKHKAPSSQPGKPLTLKWDTKGGSIELVNDEDATLMEKPTLDPNVINAIDLAERKTTESTIYKQALGEPLGGNAPYSMVSLLNHAGRLPLLDAQRAGSWAFGDIVEKAFRIMKKHSSGTSTIAGRTGYVELKTSDIPEDFIVDVEVEIDLPQDIKQNAQVAASLIAAKLTTKEFVRSKLLQIEQSDEMDKSIMIEDLVQLFVTMQIQQTMAQMQQMQQGQMPGAGGQPTPQGPGGPQPQGSGGQEMQLPPGIENLDPQQIMAMMQNGGISPEVQQEVMKRLNMQEGATSGSPLTQPVPLRGQPGGETMPTPQSMPGGPGL